MMRVKAMREASSMQTWTNSQPAPWPLARALLCPLRSPVMRWPTLWKRPSFLMSMWMSSPGCWRSVLAFVAPHRLGRLEVPEAAQAGALEDAADRSGRDPRGLGDVLAREAPAAQRDHLIDDGRARRLSQALRA